MRTVGTLCVLLVCAASVTAQTASSDARSGTVPSTPIEAGLLILPRDGSSVQPALTQEAQLAYRPQPVPQTPAGFHWDEALREYAVCLSFEHSMRLFQEKTRAELGGPFWADYSKSAKDLGGWWDGDSLFTNYVAHPVQGAVTGWVQIHNDSAGRYAQFGANGAYWRSRGKALAAAAIYSAQFELGPLSEASIGNVGLKPGTMAFVDLVMTPVGGLGMIVIEDALDRFVIEKAESRLSPNLARIMRTFLNPNRSIANIIRLQVPWHRDTRGLMSKAGSRAHRIGTSGGAPPGPSHP